MYSLNKVSSPFQESNSFIFVELCRIHICGPWRSIKRIFEYQAIKIEGESEKDEPARNGKMVEIFHLCLDLFGCGFDVLDLERVFIKNHYSFFLRFEAGISDDAVVQELAQIIAFSH